ncbi:MAG: hypothetical protein ACSHXD_13915 [Marinosulfonomonas sp.]
MASLLATSALAGSADPAPAAPIVEPAAPEWTYSVTPFIWATALSSTSTIGNVTASVDADFSSILDALDLTVMLDFRARNGDWEFGGNLVYADLSSTKTASNGVSNTVDAKMTLFELDAKKYFSEKYFGYFGGRYYDLDNTLSLGAPVNASASGRNTWIDPIVGAGFALPISGDWSFVGKGDIGGFGIGSDFAWQAQAYAQYDTSDKFSLLLGYRYLDFDYSPNTVTSSNMTISGPVAGFRFRF